MKKEKNKGITLIALIITIVVMLILVVVTLSIALGENGIVNNAKKAARDTNSAIANDANIANDVIYGDIQGIDNIVEHLTNPREKVLAEDLKEGDKVLVKLKNVELNEGFSGLCTIAFDNDIRIVASAAVPGVDKNHIQIGYFNADRNDIDISEQRPLYLYFIKDTIALNDTIEKSGWYKTTDLLTLELITELPTFEMTVEEFASDNSGVNVDKVIEFYK